MIILVFFGYFIGCGCFPLTNSLSSLLQFFPKCLTKWYALYHDLYIRIRIFCPLPIYNNNIHHFSCRIQASNEWLDFFLLHTPRFFPQISPPFLFVWCRIRPEDESIITPARRQKGWLKVAVECCHLVRRRAWFLWCASDEGATRRSLDDHHIMGLVVLSSKGGPSGHTLTRAPYLM